MVSQKLLDLPVSQFRAVPEDRAVKLCCLWCCPAHMYRASSETLALAKACQIKAISDRPFHNQECRDFLTKLGCRSNLLIGFSLNSFAFAMATKHRDRRYYLLGWPWANFSLNNNFNRACKQSFAVLSLHKNCDAGIGSLERASILSLAAFGTGTVMLDRTALERDFWGRGSVCCSGSSGGYWSLLETQR